MSARAQIALTVLIVGATYVAVTIALAYALRTLP